MKIICLVLLLPLLAANVLWGADHTDVSPQPNTPVEIGCNKQLFIDDYIIGSLDGIRKRLNQPTKHPDNPLLTPAASDESSWESKMHFEFASVLFDEEQKLFKMWYGLWERGKGDSSSVLAYATSPDGIHWKKPVLGLHEFRGTKANNIVWMPCGEANSVFRDDHETDPARRYKMLYQAHGNRTCAAYSADGLKWTAYNKGNPVIPEGRDSQNIAYWDAQLGRYVAIVRERTGKMAKIRPQIISDPSLRKKYHKLWGQWPDKKTLRRIGQAESIDFEHWTPVRVVLEADSRDPVLRGEFYNMEVMPYHGLRIGLMTVFTYDKEKSRGQVQIAYSHDGMNWHRGGNREVFMPFSNRAGDFDWGCIYPLQGPLVVGNKIWVYYTGDGYDHNLLPPSGVEGFPNGIGLAWLRLDGFVSLEPIQKEGTLTTRPLTFSGRRLLVNADAHGGQVLVEILDTRGKALPGFSSEECTALESDKIDHIVKWKNGAELDSLQGKPIQVRFHLKRARLYSFVFEK